MSPEYGPAAWKDGPARWLGSEKVKKWAYRMDLNEKYING